MTKNVLLSLSIFTICFNVSASSEEFFSFQSCYEKSQAISNQVQKLEKQEFCEEALMVQSIAIHNELSKYDLNYDEQCAGMPEQCEEKIKAEVRKLNALFSDFTFVASDSYQAANNNWKNNIAAGLESIPNKIISLKIKLEKELNNNVDIRVTLN